MLATLQELIVREIEEGTGAEIAVSIHNGGIRSGMKIWFGDLGPKNGPVAELHPHGLKSHRVRLIFGNFAGGVIQKIRTASVEDMKLARALIDLVEPGASITSNRKILDDWSTIDGSFKIEATISHDLKPETSEAVSKTCKHVIVPIMAAMAELIGYDLLENDDDIVTPAFDGAVTYSLIRRRERNPRNRLLCIRLHGEVCLACGSEPRKVYGNFGDIIEVHHLQPLASLTAPKAYDPSTDLAPLCPNCHRIAHTRAPVPWTIAEIKKMMAAVDD